MNSDSSSFRGAGRRLAPYFFAGVALCLPVVGCDIPTEPPEFESRWVVPAEETRYGVEQLLPGAVSFTPDSTAFLVDFDPVSYSETLGRLCAACALADGSTVPKPAFSDAFSSSIAFPPEVSSIEVIDGVVELELVNGLNFDPIRPSSDTFGWLTLTITDEADGDVLGTLVVDGEDTAFAPGATLVRNVDLVEATVEGPVVAEVAVASPLGDPVTIDASLSVSATATPTNVTVGGVVIDVAGRSVNLDPVPLDVQDVDAELAERVVEGAFLLDVANPFGVGAEFDISISGPTITTIQKSATIGPAGESTIRIEFTGEEIRRFLGEPDVELSGGAVIDPGTGPILVSPGEQFVLSAALDLTLRIGG